MLTKSPSSYSGPGLASSRDGELTAFARSLLDAARKDWIDRLVTEPDGKGDPAQLYTETHYAMAAVLLFLGGAGDRGLLDLAAHRLRLWNAANGPMFAFNAMAVCLTAIVFRRSGEPHPGLESILRDLIARAPEYRHQVYGMPCGNNAYLQQVAVDTVLLPLAREQQIAADGVNVLVGEFQRYRTPEGFFYDLPRAGTAQERLCPPTYIMKMLFVAGICHELHPIPALAQLFESGMAAALPLLTRQGLFSYFGRTDNSPFSAGLTIFNLRKAARMSATSGAGFSAACAAAERYYATFPRTPLGLLLCNRFSDATSPAEYARSRDDYAYVGQYSLSSCAYALLGRLWFPDSGELAPMSETLHRVPSIAVSRDLAVVKLDGRDSELILRTGAQPTSSDRRYLGPTILRYERQGRLLVGAISRTVSTDMGVRGRSGTRARRALALFRDRLAHGFEQLDGTSVGFLPVLRRGAADYFPYRVLASEASATRVRTDYEMVKLHARGWRACAIEATTLLRQNVPFLLGLGTFTRPQMNPAPSITLERQVLETPRGCRIEDRIVGDLRGTTLLFSVRYLPGGSVRIDGLTRVRSVTGWGSDGRQALDLYEAAPHGSEIAYRCDIELAEHAGR